MDTKQKIEELKEMIQKANYIVFFGGAGVSTESGLPDFRSVDGLYHQKYVFPRKKSCLTISLWNDQRSFIAFIKKNS